MNRGDDELNQLLRAARVPMRTPEYWAEFPDAVQREIRRPTERGAAEMPAPRSAGSWAWGVSFAAVCMGLAFFAGFWRGHTAGFSAAEVAQSRQIYRELAALFPGQLQAVQLDARATQLMLASDAQPPASAPLLVQICHAGNCRRFITFSGQRVAVNGEMFEILSDAAGHVFVIGERVVWTSGEPRRTAAGYRIRATPLEDVL